MPIDGQNFKFLKIQGGSWPLC